MASSPKYKVYSNDGEYVASCKNAEDAAILVSIGYGDRGTVRLGHGVILYTNGVDGNSDSYDGIAEVIYRREEAYQQAQYRKAHG